ncbi:MAG: metallophosphoesterase [Magnetococcus sp. WYHC-3]
MQKTAIVSDIHSNLEAFTAVLAEIDRLGIKTIFSLGDTVGYGPDPEACVRLAVARCQVRVLGNHEYTLANPDQLPFNPQAKKAIDWTRIQLAKARLIEDASNLETYYKRGDYLFVHGSVRDVVSDYVMETDREGFSSFDDMINTLTYDFTGFTICFVGHNHRPFLATREGFIHPHDDVNEFSVAGEKLYVSVGSVGQPRDDDPRSSFVVFDGETIKYHRVAYDVERTVAKMLAVGLPSAQAYRLRTGE